MSVFRAANSTTSWPASADPYEDGPTERLASADWDGPAEPPPRRGVVFAVLLAMLALLVSAGAVLIAWRALGRAEEAFRRAPAPVAGYSGERLLIQAGCGTTTFVDLDEPRVGVPAAAGDLRYQSFCEKGAAPRLALGPGAATGGPPKDGCAGVSALGATAVPAQKGLVLCVLTGPPAASPGPSAAPGIDAGADRAGALVVRVEVIDVTADGTANLRATSWAVR
ncbi:hypothetical protein ACIBSW_39285 [Actinoplanes sp. NPDC049668]|uniref:hypothetical protein n=1 Tax=unclassified Actinoplanes TaxID=2626549 RepID=UPI0033A7FCFE